MLFRSHVIDQIAESPSTSVAIAAVRQFSDRKNLLVVVSRTEDIAWRALRNSTDLHLIVNDQLNAYDVLKSDDVVFTEKAIREFITKPATAVARESEVEVSA